LQDPIGKLVSFFNKFPGVGNKSARRMTFFLLKQDVSFLRAMGGAIAELKDNMVNCGSCGNVSESDPCPICGDVLRDRSTLCVVESIDDLASFEQAGVYNGLYHVLDGRVSPMDDQELSEQCVDFLLKHIADTGAEEVIIATNPKMEGDLTFFTLKEILRERLGVKIDGGAEKAEKKGPKISRLAFGLPVGGSIEFADRVTLHTALEARVVSK
jgi:recombination protein RecR